MTRYPYPQWPDLCLYDAGPKIASHWPLVQGNQWSIPPAVDVQFNWYDPFWIGPKGYRFGQRLEHAQGDWWRYKRTYWNEPDFNYSCQVTYNIKKINDVWNMVLNVTLFMVHDIPIGMSIKNVPYTDPDDSNQIPWKQPYTLWMYTLPHGHAITSLQIMPVRSDHMWPVEPF